MANAALPPQPVALAGPRVLRCGVPGALRRALAERSGASACVRLAAGSASEALDLAAELALTALWLLPPLDAEAGALVPGGGPGGTSNLLERGPAGWRSAWVEPGDVPQAVTPPPARRVLLAGFMGAGKSTLGRMLAERLGWAFEDTDLLVEAEAGGTLAAVFAREGEAGFRARERRAVARALVGERAVVALGGGALDDPQNRQRVAMAGTTVLLWAPLPVLLARVSDGARPMLDGRIEPAALLARRRATYLGAADLVISSAGDTPTALAARLEDELWAGGRIP